MHMVGNDVIKQSGHGSSKLTKHETTHQPRRQQRAPQRVVPLATWRCHCKYGQCTCIEPSHQLLQYCTRGPYRLYTESAIRSLHRVENSPLPVSSPWTRLILVWLTKQPAASAVVMSHCHFLSTWRQFWCFVKYFVSIPCWYHFIRLFSQIILRFLSALLLLNADVIDATVNRIIE